MPSGGLLDRNCVEFGFFRLTHGFDVAFYALAGVAALAAVLGAVLIESHPAAQAEEAEFNAVPIEEAA
jgi:hypothetical protein